MPEERKQRQGTSLPTTGPSVSGRAQTPTNTKDSSPDNNGDGSPSEAPSMRERVRSTAASIVENTKDLSHKASHEAHNVARQVHQRASEASERLPDEMRDPAVSTTVLFTAVTASAACTYLTQQQRQGKFSWLVATGIIVGLTALSVAEYFSVKAYFRRNGSSQ